MFGVLISLKGIVLLLSVVHLIARLDLTKASYSSDIKGNNDMVYFNNATFAMAQIQSDASL